MTAFRVLLAEWDAPSADWTADAERQLVEIDDYDLPMRRELLSLIRTARDEVEAELLTLTSRLEPGVA